MLNTPQPHPRHGTTAGMTLVELVIAMLIVAMLATLAVPGWQTQVRRLRRSDAITPLAQLQQAQERWRSQHPLYASGLGRDGLDLPVLSPAGHYDLTTSVQTDSAHRSYRVTAIARGPQADDLACRWLVLDLDAGQLHHRSGPDAQLGNTDAQNRQCWTS
ncbi:type IV pilin protein [Sphaerotilus sp.]|uniref:type IV pilin protein n=1 Tax=Sphaerotilus sp. TaxID=2093942 RepID=UPI0025EF45D9|nr:type IV pilin protein [Sphaerotilus sp.]